MIALICFVLAVLASPFKSNIRREVLIPVHAAHHNEMMSPAVTE